MNTKMNMGMFGVWPLRAVKQQIREVRAYEARVAKIASEELGVPLRKVERTPNRIARFERQRERRERSVAATESGQTGRFAPPGGGV